MKVVDRFQRACAQVVSAVGVVWVLAALACAPVGVQSTPPRVFTGTVEGQPKAQDPALRPTTKATEATRAQGGKNVHEPTASVAPPTVTEINGEALARNDGALADPELSQGDQAFAVEDWSSAGRAYEAARRKAPADPAAYVGLARVRLAEKQLPLAFAAAPGDRAAQAALALADRALALDSSYGLAQLERGRILLILGDASLAIESFAKAQQLLPRNAEAYGGMGVARLATGAVKEALLGFKEAARLEPGNAARLGNLGTAHLMLGQVTEALQVYRQAAQLAPEDPRAQGDVGTALLALNQPAEALAFLGKAHQLAPERATFLSNIGYARALQGQLPLAITSYRQALALDPKLASAWINLGVALSHQQKFVEAEAALKQALALDPTDPRAKVNLEELRELMKTQAQKP